MRVFWSVVFGVVLGALAVVVAQRNPAGRSVVQRVSRTLESLLDGAVQGFRDSSR